MWFFASHRDALGRMAGKRGGAGRASPRAAKARRADDPAVAAARRAALDGELDETTALRLFLAGGDRGRCGRTCKGNAKRVDCVCGLVPPVGGFRRTGLWRRDTDAAVIREEATARVVALPCIGVPNAAVKKLPGEDTGLLGVCKLICTGASSCVVCCTMLAMMC